MFVQMICKDRNEKEMNELYEVLGLIARREEVQIEDRYDHVDILVCPQGKIVVTEEGFTCQYPSCRSRLSCVCGRYI